VCVGCFCFFSLGCCVVWCGLLPPFSFFFFGVGLGRWKSAFVIHVVVVNVGFVFILYCFLRRDTKEIAKAKDSLKLPYKVFSLKMPKGSLCVTSSPSFFYPSQCVSLLLSSTALLFRLLPLRLLSSLLLPLHIF
jgi:hypothetical protein